MRVGPEDHAGFLPRMDPLQPEAHELRRPISDYPGSLNPQHLSVHKALISRFQVTASPTTEDFLDRDLGTIQGEPVQRLLTLVSEGGWWDTSA